MGMETFRIDRIPTPIGVMLLVQDRAQRLRALDWEDHEPRMARLLRRHYGGVELVPGDGRGAIADALRSYLAGTLDAIEGIPVETAGTKFQRRVWRELRRIPAGATLSYRELAGRIGRPDAVRAVGLANGANPVGVVVPCHRVIGSDGGLTGYGGGLERKRWLLEHEGVSVCEGHGDRRSETSPDHAEPPGASNALVAGDQRDPQRDRRSGDEAVERLAECRKRAGFGDVGPLERNQ